MTIERRNDFTVLPSVSIMEQCLYTKANVQRKAMLYHNGRSLA